MQQSFALRPNWALYCDESLPLALRTLTSLLVWALWHGWDVTTCVGHSGWLFKLYLHRRRQHCTDEAQKAETVLSAVRYSSLVQQSFALRPNWALYCDESLPLALRTLTSSLVWALWHGWDVTTCVGHSGWLFKLYLHRRRQHCTDEAQKAETVLSAVSYIYMYVCMYVCTYIHKYIHIYIYTYI